ncbi:hypothetical protein pipiens_000943, partial [Culex pipiens pipiens]
MRAFKAFIAFAERQSRVFGLNVRFPLMTLTAGDDRLAMTDDDSRSTSITAITMFGGPSPCSVTSRVLGVHQMVHDMRQDVLPHPLQNHILQMLHNSTVLG